MSNLEFYVLDTETTGLKVNWNEVVQVSCIRASNKVQLNRIIRAEYPERAQAQALQITGKTHEDLRHGVDSLEAIEMYDNYFASDGKTPAHRVVVAHNAAFDRKFCHAMWARHGKTFPAHLWVDTIPMTRAWAEKQGIVKPKVSLAASMDLLKTKRVAGLHNASSDAKNLYFLWQRLLEEGVDYLPYIKNEPHYVESASSVTEDANDLL